MKLTLVGLPLGNIKDISLRAIETLGGADLVICEDSRVFQKLWQKLVNEGYLDGSFKGRMKVINEFHERDKLENIIEAIKETDFPILVSDAGMPAFSDPGFHLVNKVIKQGGEIEVVPGPTAAQTALSLSGFSSDRVLFLGFLPKKSGKRSKLWSDINKLETNLTVLIYESPYRVAKTLEEVMEKLGDLECVMARELTKQYQEVLRGRVDQLLERTKSKVLKGEVVIVLRK